MQVAVLGHLFFVSDTAIGFATGCSAVDFEQMQPGLSGQISAFFEILPAKTNAPAIIETAMMPILIFFFMIQI